MSPNALIKPGQGRRSALGTLVIVLVSMAFGALIALSFEKESALGPLNGLQQYTSTPGRG
jgi:hypothetical protein